MGALALGPAPVGVTMFHVVHFRPALIVDVRLQTGCRDGMDLAGALDITRCQGLHRDGSIVWSNGTPGG